MRVITALACLLTLLVMPCASASGDLFEDISTAVDDYNQQIDNLPSFLKAIENERINCEIQREDGGSMVIGVVFDGSRASIQRGGLNDPSVTASLDEETVREILDSASPLKAVAAALEDGGITYNIHGGLWKKFRYNMLERLLISRY